MKGMIDWFARNTVAANLLMVFIVVTGSIAVVSIKAEVFPEMELDRISVQVPYLGAAPEEVEEAVNIRIEEAVQGIDGIKQLQSTANEGMGMVMIELELDADARKVVDDVKSNVDAITTFPVETEKADHSRADHPEPGGRHRGQWLRRPLHAEGAQRAGSQRVVEHPRDHSGRYCQCTALRDLDRGLRGRPQTAWHDLRSGGGCGPQLVD